jgi:four helix bundle protein
MTTPLHSHRDLIVWQKAMNLVVCIYAFTQKFPPQEMYGLTSQMRRASVSIPSNIAEGRKRGNKKDFRNFVLIAYASGGELETQLEIARRLSFGDPIIAKHTEKLLDEVMRMLNGLVVSLGVNPKKPRS